MVGKLSAFMTAQHRELDNLLLQVGSDGASLDSRAYQSFRELLLRHIRIEERILLPMAERKQGAALPIAARLRLDHGALAALVMLPPSSRAFRALRALLDAHNPLEESEDGAYARCEGLAGAEMDELLVQIETAPPVPVSPWIDDARIIATAKRALARAGHNSALLDAIHDRN